MDRGRVAVVARDEDAVAEVDGLAQGLAGGHRRERCRIGYMATCSPVLRVDTMDAGGVPADR